MENNDNFSVDTECSFVSVDYIVCACGESFSSEDLLKEHLEEGHSPVSVPLKQKKELKPVVVYSQQQRQVYLIKDEDEEVGENFAVQQPTSPSTPPPAVKEELVADPYDEENLNYLISSGQAVQRGLILETVQEIETDEASQESNADPLSMTPAAVAEPLQPGSTTCYFCDRCGKGLPSERAAARHVRFAHKQNHESNTTKSPRPRKPRTRAPPGSEPRNPKIVACEVCGNTYSSHAALRYHQRVHTGERPYPCTMCPKAFTMPLFLQIHTRIHTGEKPYQCQECTKAFGSRAALLRHERVHTGVRPYACPWCQKTFTQSNSLKLHVRTVHLRVPAPYKSAARRRKQAVDTPVKPAPFPGLLPITYKQLKEQGVNVLSSPELNLKVEVPEEQLEDEDDEYEYEISEVPSQQMYSDDDDDDDN